VGILSGPGQDQDPRPVPGDPLEKVGLGEDAHRREGLGGPFPGVPGTGTPGKAYYQRKEQGRDRTEHTFFYHEPRPLVYKALVEPCPDSFLSVPKVIIVFCCFMDIAMIG
jgi:hypothetical protein